MFRLIYACMILAMAVESAIEHGQDAADSGAKKPPSIRQRLAFLTQSKKAAATQVVNDPSCGLPKWKYAWCDKLTNRNYGCMREWDEMDELADPPVYPAYHCWRSCDESECDGKGSEKNWCWTLGQTISCSVFDMGEEHASCARASCINPNGKN